MRTTSGYTCDTGIMQAQLREQVTCLHLYGRLLLLVDSESLTLVF